MPGKNHRSNFIDARKTERQTPLSNAIKVLCPKKNVQDKSVLMEKFNQILAKYDRKREKQLLDEIFRNSK